MFGTTPAGPQVYQRQALGLPAGSVRALLALGVLGLLWLLVLRYDEQHKLPLEFIYLEYLMLLILASYFTAHGKTIGVMVSPRSPLGLPSGIIRLLLMAGYLGLAIYMWRDEHFQFDAPLSAPPYLLILLLLSTFFAGYVLTGLVHWISGAIVPAWYQDIQAWIAILALIGMAVLAAWHLLIRPSLDVPYETPMALEAALAAIVGFYFGARSI